MRRFAAQASVARGARRRSRRSSMSPSRPRRSPLEKYASSMPAARPTSSGSTPTARKPASSCSRKPTGSFELGTFTFLGFTHFWDRIRKGGWAVQRKTAKDRFARAIEHIGVWCRRHRHDPIAEQHRVLSLELRGHGAYYGITGNVQAIRQLRWAVRRVWRKWLARRSHKTRMTWEDFVRLAERCPPATCLGRSLYVPPACSETMTRGAGCVVAHVRICGSPGCENTRGHPAADGEL